VHCMCFGLLSLTTKIYFYNNEQLSALLKARRCRFVHIVIPVIARHTLHFARLTIPTGGEIKIAVNDHKIVLHCPSEDGRFVSSKLQMLLKE